MNNSKLKLTLFTVALVCLCLSLLAMSACTVTDGNNSVDPELLSNVDFMGNALFNEAVLTNSGINADERVNVFIRLEGEALYEQMDTFLESKACKYPNSAQKIAFMMRRFEEDGFTSYWL